MQDPIGAFRRIRELYLSYLDTAFRIEDPTLTEERRTLLRRPGQLCTSPLLEAQPRWANYEFDFDQIRNAEDEGFGESDEPVLGHLTQKAREAFVDLIGCGLMPSSGEGMDRKPFPPYVHQAQMLARGCRDSQAGVVTSGTGSGKTEAFLLPILATIMEEATREGKEWARPEPGYLQRFWWRSHDGLPMAERNQRGKYEIRSDARFTEGQALGWDGYSENRKRKGDIRKPAIRALILYPMNALVEDQMCRLRLALDSREARECQDRHLNGNRIFFGRYTGKTKGGPAFLMPYEEILGNLDTQELQQTVGDAIPGLPQGGTVLKDWKKRVSSSRKRRIEEVIAELSQADDLQREIRRAAGIAEDQQMGLDADQDHLDRAFAFPSVDGGELLTRWDMQDTPPDILVTNISMLNAMLSRSTEAGMLDATREWLESDPANRFTLVIDELHLQRGSEGTEFIYLLRLLIARLGLDDQQRHNQLRILASSASLPVEGKEAESSLDYLYDAFADFGMPYGSSRNDWEQAIVPGFPKSIAKEEPLPLGLTKGTLLDEAIDGLLESKWGRKGMQLDELFSQADLESDGEAFKVFFDAMGVEDGELLDRWVRFAHGVGNLLEIKSRYSGAVPLATTLTDLAFEAWGKTAWADDRIERNLRVLTAFIGASDGKSEFADRLKSAAARLGLEVSRFRLHTFFKSPEGLFVDVVPPAGRSLGALERWQGNLSLDRNGTTRTSSTKDPGREVRQFELLYCEACGETFLGGMRSVYDQEDPDVLVEVLPDEGRIERLPDLPVADRFEELNHCQYVVIWPKDDAGETIHDLGHREDTWVRGFLDVCTGIVKRNRGNDEGLLQPVYVFRRKVDRGMKGPFADDQPGSHTPCSCPCCNTDYGPRRKKAHSGQQVSPLRNFRAGFAKSTQLLATEAYDVMARGGDRSKAKLVSFSDSRQDAARSALDVERFRHQDVIREVLFGELRSASYAIKNGLQDEERRLERRMRMLESLHEEEVAEGDNPPHDLLEDIENQKAEIHKLEAKIAQAKAGIVPLAEIVEVTAPKPNTRVLPFLARLLELGIHPYDERGIKKVEIRGAKSSWIEWWRLFGKAPDGVGYCWQIPEGYNLDESDFRRLVNGFLAEKVLDAIGDVIFKKNYFALESTGFAYPVPLGLNLFRADGTFDLRKIEQAAAWMRIYADQYRFAPSNYQKCDGLDPSSMTKSSGLAKTVRKIAEAKGGVDPVEFFRRGQDLMAEAGYSDSAGDYVRLGRMGFRIASDTEPVLRCANCRRVHLHNGLGVCTRCGGNFSPPEAAETVNQLINGNFLGRRLARALDDNGDQGDVFRLRCEELTAQTTDPAQRQREFKGIRLESDRGDQLAPHGIEMLMVTTTMEVGIDIGPLQTVMQANMPPQRFNYQQRVGRAGRRGQAFSFVVTLCRSKSHDLHYFNRPEVITGEAPPPPFLVKRLSRIAERLVSKECLVRAFDLIRTEDRGSGLGLWAGDVVRPVDVHGDFIPTTILEGPESVRQFWQNRLIQALEKGQDQTEAIVKLFERDRREGKGDCEDLRHKSARELVNQIFSTTSTAASNTPGLAAHLADRGLLPMYGLPTRVRQLVIGRRRSDGFGEQVEVIDRDLEIAIYEFAPGNVLVHDKKEHLCIGLTPRISRAGTTRAGTTFVTSGPVADRYFHLASCSVCGSHHKLNDEDTIDSMCPSCGALIGADTTVRLCLEPASFRTDFTPRSDETNRLPGGRGRSLCADSKPPDGPWLESKPQAHDLFAVDLRWNVSPTSTVYRINRGVEQASGDSGFMFRGKVGLLASGFTQGTPGPLASQAIDERCLQGDLSRAILGDAPAPLDFENQPVYLAAQRVTDGLYIQPTGLNPLLALDRLGRNLVLPFDNQAGIGLLQATGESYWQGVRAAAVSALEVLAGKASLKLDIDRAGLEVLEPRLFGVPERLLPLFQIVDAHVNGAGFSAWLGKTDTVAPPIVDIVHELLESRDGDSNWFRDDHADDCGEACYRCLKSYDNQGLHGLLDWRLGLCYLRAFADPTWTCGLDGDFSWKPLEHWPQKARALAESTVTLWGGTLGADTIKAFVPTGWTHELTAFRIPLGTGSQVWLSPWIIVRHPLWNCGPAVDGPLGDFRDDFIGEGHTSICWDDFNLRRRRGMTKQWIVSMSPRKPLPPRRRRSR
mgnify:CR=1 FL=1